MIYLKEPNTNRIVEFQNEASIGAGFANWIRLNEKESLAYELEKAKDSKLSQLKTNKDKSLDGFVLISVDSFNFNIYKNQLEVLSARIYYLESNKLTSSNWTDNDNFRRELTLSQFKDLYARSRNHYTALDDNVYALYTNLKNEIKACATLEELENININF
jgi:hypothetical protein